MSRNSKVRIKVNEKVASQLAAEVATTSAVAYQEVLDGVLRDFQGRPLDEVKAALAERWNQIGGRVTDPALTAYASRLARGERIEMRVGDVEDL